MTNLHTKNGALSTEYGEFLPALENAEYEIDNDAFTVEPVTIHSDMFTQYLKPGQYTKVVGLVKVTRYYPVDSEK